MEVNRTRPAERRKKGKTNRLDAYRAARSVLSGEATADPKRASIEPLRALTVARRSAVKAQQAAWRQIGSVLVNAPAHLRDRYRVLPEARLVAALATTRPSQARDATQADTLYSLRSQARRYQGLGEEIAGLEQRMLERASAANPALMAVKGVGPVIGAQLLITAGDNPDRLRSSASFAALCGTAPIPVSSGRTDRHRLSRGGDRQANTALHHIVKNPMSYDKPTPTATRTWQRAGRPKPSTAPSNEPSPARSTVPWQAAARCPTTPTGGLPAGPRTSSSPPSRPNSGSGPPASGSSNSADAETTTSPSATGNGSTPLDNILGASLPFAEQGVGEVSQRGVVVVAECDIWAETGHLAVAVGVDTGPDQGVDGHDPPPSRTFSTRASAVRKVNGPASSRRRVRNCSTWASRSLTISDTCDLLSVVIPNDWTSLSIRRVETPSR